MFTIGDDVIYHGRRGIVVDTHDFEKPAYLVLIYKTRDLAWASDNELAEAPSINSFISPNSVILQLLVLLSFVAFVPPIVTGISIVIILGCLWGEIVVNSKGNL